MARINQRGRNNNNPEGHNQYSGGWMDSAKDNPMKTAAAAAGAVAAGVFLWSKRDRISDQITRLSDQVSEWADEMRSGNGFIGSAMSSDSTSDAALTKRADSTGSRSTRSRATGARSSARQSETSSPNAGNSGAEAVTH